MLLLIAVIKFILTIAFILAVLLTILAICLYGDISHAAQQWLGVVEKGISLAGILVQLTMPLLILLFIIEHW